MKNDQSIVKRVRQLQDELHRHNRLYYIDSRPEVSDREFDKLLAELVELEAAHPELSTPDSPTRRVGGEVASELAPVRHAAPMMSIDNTYSEDEVRAFDERVRKALKTDKPAYVLEPKIDGTAISLRYVDGILVQAATRGRGNVGEDITVNARTIRSVPLRLTPHGKGKAASIPPILEVRGEVYMDNEDFHRVNREIEANGDEPYANPRNLTSGTVRRLDPKIVAKRRLRFLAHGVGQVEPMPVDTYWELVELLRAWGLPLAKEMRRVESIDDALKCIHDFEQSRRKLPYMTDGMVMKVDAFDQRDALGNTSKSPRWVVAYKYEAEQQSTIINDVDWQVGKGGNLTPVGKLDPVFISGVTVSNVTLHNIEQIKRLDIRLGDTVVVERAGEVIPQVVAVVEAKRPKGAKPIESPSKCPVCGTKVLKDPDTPIVRCPNSECPAQVRERLFWFAGRSQMDIDGLGSQMIDQLVTERLVKNFADFYHLTAEQLADLTHDTQLGEKKAASIVENIAAQSDEIAPLVKSIKGSTDEVVSAIVKKLKLAGLGERTVAQLIETELVKKPKDLLSLQADDLAELSQGVRVGEANAKHIIAGIEKSKSRGLARVLAGLGVRLVGNTASNAYAQWAGNIDKLLDASLDDLGAVLAKNPEEQLKTVQKERARAVALHAAIHQKGGASLFESPKTDETTEDFLADHDKGRPRGEQVGKSRIAKLAKAFPLFAELREASVDAIEDVLVEGRAVARSLYEYLHSKTGQHSIDALRKAGVAMTEAQAVTRESQWTGKTLVITGSFEGFSRDQIKKQLISLGADVTDSVSAKTSGVFVGEDAGSKLDKAKSLGITIFGPDDVVRLMSS